ncbi:hypothetical protein CHARACLAT_017340 [Characodon lateralis]|uniref:Uncharacterized protein n=1 Tax=Characodon lateralis TaxID=208331 RepID=A0ABU7DHV1_9TELE|nr:hypothetical protein [Characodon lateralis]
MAVHQRVLPAPHSVSMRQLLIQTPPILITKETQGLHPSQAAFGLFVFFIQRSNEIQLVDETWTSGHPFYQSLNLPVTKTRLDSLKLKKATKKVYNSRKYKAD